MKCDPTFSGDRQKWLIASKNAVTGGFYTNEFRRIEKSSSNPSAYPAKWYRRQGAKEDPWISLTNHDVSIQGGDIIYGENNWGGDHAGKILPKHNGANVYIRYKEGNLDIFYMIHECS